MADKIYIIERKFKGNYMTPSAFQEVEKWVFNYWTSEEPKKKHWSDERYEYRSNAVRSGERIPQLLSKNHFGFEKDW